MEPDNDFMTVMKEWMAENNKETWVSGDLSHVECAMRKAYEAGNAAAEDLERRLTRVDNALDLITICTKQGCYVYVRNAGAWHDPTKCPIGIASMVRHAMKKLGG